MNLAIIYGRIGADMELRYTSGGKAVCNFSVATGRKTGTSDYTQWHRVVAWERTAELCAEHLGKGSLVLVKGEINYSSYEKDGVTKYTTEIKAAPYGGVTFGPKKAEDDLPF